MDGSGNIYIADRGNNAIKEWHASTQTATTLVSSGLNNPYGLAVDSSGNIYIADTYDNAIKEWSASTQTVTTLVSSGLSEPYGVAVDRAGNVYIADTDDNAIKEWHASTQTITTLVSSGLNSPFGVAVDSSGNVYIADTYNNAVKEWHASTQTVTTLVSTSIRPYALAMDGSGNVYIADISNNAIKEWHAATQTVTTLFSSGLNTPYGVAVDASGDIYVAYSGQNEIDELPHTYVPESSVSEGAASGNDALPAILPPTQSLTGVFAPTSDQSWLTIGSAASGVVGFSFTANSSSPRTADITVLGQAIAVTQQGSQTISFPAPPTAAFNPSQPITLSATASSGYSVSFSIVSGPATVAGSLLTMTGSGVVTVEATQAGSASYAAAPPVVQSFTISQAFTTTTLTESSVTAVYGQPVTLTASIAAISPGGGTPAGTVQFSDGGSVLANISVIAGIATYTTTSLAVGSHALTAAYSGSVNYYTSNSNTVTLAVSKSATGVALVSSGNPSAFGTEVTFTTNVTATSPGSGVPTGTVTFYDGSAPLLTAALSNGAATYSTSSLAVGSHSLTALYNAEDPRYQSSVSAAVVQVVNPPAPAVQSVVINGGQVQRSMVTSIAVTFNGAVNTSLLQNAFILTRVGLPNGVAGDNAAPSTISVATSTNSSGNTVAILTFSGSNTEGASLADGNWTLDINHSDVQNGGTQMTTDYVQSGIKRLFGDIYGTGTVDSADLGLFGTTFGLTSNSAAFIAGFDSDGNGVIDSTDLGAFGTRFGLTI